MNRNYGSIVNNQIDSAILIDPHDNYRRCGTDNPYPVNVSACALPTGAATESTVSNCQTLLTSAVALLNGIDTNTQPPTLRYDPQLSLAAGEISSTKRIVKTAYSFTSDEDRIMSYKPSGWDSRITYTPLTTAESWEIVSSSSEDASGNNGAREITIEGIDSLGSYQTHTVVPNGTSAVDVSGSWLCVNSIKITSAGSDMHATGNIELRKKSDGAIRAWIVADEVENFQMRYRAPSDRRLFLKKLLIVSLQYSGTHMFSIRAYNPSTNTYRKVLYYNISCSNTPIELNLGGVEIEAGSEVVVNCINSNSHSTFEISVMLVMDETP